MCGAVICAGNRVARKIQFAERIQSDLGRPAVLANIFRFPITPNQWFFPCCPVSARGAFRDRHEREMGCGGRDSVGAQDGRRVVDPHERQSAHKTNGADAYGKTVWS
jgi:hypothetical protein